jgi:acetate kinase
VRVLVVNAGSSSLKLRLVGDGDEQLGERDLAADEELVDLGDLAQADAIGHRVVHGGTRFREAVVIDGAVVQELRALTELAPLHQPKSLFAMDVVGRALPAVPAVACFDTAFHATLPPEAFTYPLPRAWRQRFPIRRYGFHGLSHAYAARRAAELLERDPSELRIVTCHLGAGASLTAVRAGRSVDTTMGFTPLEGLCMATRSGTVDPGLVLWLVQRGDLGAADVEHALEHDAGLAALAGDADMRAVLAAAEAGDADARLGLDVYVHRLRAGIAAMAAAMAGLDALVFTGGVGENAPAVRAFAADGLGFLGVRLDPDRNALPATDRDISAAGADVRTLVVRAREEVEIARQVRRVLVLAGRLSCDA